MSIAVKTIPVKRKRVVVARRAKEDLSVPEGIPQNNPAEQATFTAEQVAMMMRMAMQQGDGHFGAQPQGGGYTYLYEQNRAVRGGNALSQSYFRARKQPGNVIERADQMTESTLASIFGCSGVFDICDDADLMSLSFAGQEPFLDWLGWMTTSVCNIQRGFITWVRPDNDGASAGWLSDPCATPNGVEYGVAEFEVNGFARLRRDGPVRDFTQSKVSRCISEPRWRLDGRVVTSEREYSQYLATEVILQDLKRMVVTGDSAVAGQFSGIETLVTDGYIDRNGRRVHSMDSAVIDWNGNPMTGGAGITWNGTPVSSSFNIVDVIRYAMRLIRQRIKWAPALAAQRLREGNFAVILPDFLAYCLLDFFTCWSLCEDGVIVQSVLNSLEGRQFRDTLNGGMFGAGTVTIDGIRIPLIAYDWELIKNASGTIGDIYIGAEAIGNIKTTLGEMNDMRAALDGQNDRNSYFYTDGGKMLGWLQRDQTCEKSTFEMQPRLTMWAPWTWVRIANVRCETPFYPISPDPNSSFFPEKSFVPAGS